MTQHPSWDDSYRTTPPWDIGRPQPVFVELVKNREMAPGNALDVGCGTGENAIFLARNGFSVTGVDLAESALKLARSKASQAKVKVDFRNGNVLTVDLAPGSFDTVIDSGLFHTFDDLDRPIFAAKIARVLRQGGSYFMMCFSDKEPTGWGGPRRVTKKEIEQTFSPDFKINYIHDAYFTTRIHENGGRAYLTHAQKR